MKYFLLVFFSCLIQQTFAANAVMLTSLKLSDGKIKKMERLFHEAFDKSDLSPVIIHNAGPKQLFEIFSSADNEVVIWVSHAAADRPLKEGISAENIIMDIYGNDVKKFFTTPSQSLRFLGIVGCEAQSIVEQFRSKNLYHHTPNLEIMSFDKKIELFSGLKMTLSRSQEVLARETEVQEDYKPELIQFYGNRSASKSAGWLELGDRVIGYFDASENVSTKLLSYDYEMWGPLSNRNLKFFRDLSTNQDEPLSRMNFSIHSALGTWKVFADAQGKVLGGKNQQLYIYKP